MRRSKLFDAIPVIHSMDEKPAGSDELRRSYHSSKEAGGRHGAEGDMHSAGKKGSKLCYRSGNTGGKQRFPRMLQQQFSGTLIVDPPFCARFDKATNDVRAAASADEVAADIAQPCAKQISGASQAGMDIKPFRCSGFYADSVRRDSLFRLCGVLL